MAAVSKQAYTLVVRQDVGEEERGEKEDGRGRGRRVHEKEGKVHEKEGKERGGAQEDQAKMANNTHQSLADKNSDYKNIQLVPAATHTQSNTQHVGGVHMHNTVVGAGSSNLPHSQHNTQHAQEHTSNENTNSSNKDIGQQQQGQ